MQQLPGRGVLRPGLEDASFFGYPPYPFYPRPKSSFDGNKWDAGDGPFGFSKGLWNR